MPERSAVVGRLVDELRFGTQAVLHRVGAPSLAWRLGLGEERAFWDEYLATDGLHWPEEFAERVRPDRELTGPVAELVRAVPHDPVRLLDVGSGPLSAFAGSVPGRQIELTAADPLADWYAELYGRHGVDPAVRPVAVRAEQLRRRFPRDHFDLVVARNALDHSVDPVAALRQMLAVVRPGGWVYLEHAEREGANRRYRGLHHWDVQADAGHLVVGHREARTDLTVDLAEAADVAVETDDEGWVRARLHRLTAPA